ncbi:type II toxin-antitoxin system prevent-host-death family antitoxin [Candidatus Aquarickettsia rohweri]|uniref:Antitoxin n=1 Tax=Candidatus Aquarickettsia rohweri TaxID=2602574 RepID=A0A429XEH2_9RICK|nr:type II toxin-antitoxin system prevent-host-death family antitoxin [Candidatus Aquarickettsia rohweri]RST62144.1 type II toxin-antitoxin system prevent-host-death family antitoxin [Candidatus Aquarickettsia rohweri]
MEISSTELKTHLGEYLNEAMRKPVFIKRHKSEAVLISREEYDRLQNLEDAYLMNEIHLAEQNGYIGVEETMKKMKNALSKS